jgi:branched-chain amino acid transport system ATP-binding protein
LAEYILKIEKLTKTFGGVVAVNNLDLRIEHGQTFSLIGPNGAGKSTVFNLISGIMRPDKGEIFFKNQSLVNKLPHSITELGVGRTFQLVRLFSQMTVLENVWVGMYYRHRNISIRDFFSLRSENSERKKLREEAEELLRRLGLGHRLSSTVSSLPYGEKRLLEIARALAGEPSLLMVDEPSAGMNESEISRLKGIILDLKNDRKTIFLIEHNVRMVMDISDRVAVIDFGAKIGEGTPKEVQANEQVISAYLGTKG